MNFLSLTTGKEKGNTLFIHGKFTHKSPQSRNDGVMHNVTTAPAGKGTNRLLGLFYRNGHVYGAVFSMSENGYFERYDPIDFIGTTPKFHTSEIAESGLLIPISPGAAARLKDITDSIKGDKTRFYYKSTWEGFNPAFERQGCNPVDYDGSEIPVPEDQKRLFERAAGSPPAIPTNCIHFLLNACRHDAHIPLQDLHPALHSTYEAEILPFVVNDLMFYGEPLEGFPNGKWIDVPGGSAIIAIQGDHNRCFKIPDDINALQDGKGECAVLELLHTTALDHTVSPTPHITGHHNSQRILGTPEKDSMTQWL